MLRDEFGNIFDPLTIRYLKYIINKTDAKTVVTSTWRLSGIEFIKSMWKQRGLPGEVIGITPFLSGKIRGEEIRSHLMLENQKGIDIESYVIIDDDNDMLEGQKNNFVRTNPVYGLTLSDAEKCIEILNRL